jgi:hypothetical protein
MDLAYAAGRAGGTMTGVLSAANEKAVELFIDEKYDSLCTPTCACFLLDRSLHVLCHLLIWFVNYSANFSCNCRKEKEKENFGPTKVHGHLLMRMHVLKDIIPKYLLSLHYGLEI